MSKYETVAVPFVTIGNKQFLSCLEVYRNPELMDFIKRFEICFEWSYDRIGWYYYPEGVPKGNCGGY